jgi:ribosome-associated protein
MDKPGEPSGNILPLRGEHITLAQAVKVVGLAASGGQAKHLVREGAVRVNRVVETQPGRKLRAGDRFGSADGPEWTVVADPNL